MRPLIRLLILFCLGLSSCTILSQGQPGTEPTASPELPWNGAITATKQTPTEPTTTPEIYMPLPAEQRAFETVRAKLAGDLGVDPLLVTLVDVIPVDWPDSCLGLPALGEMCAQVVTPGFRVRVQEGMVVFEFHTDQDAQNLRQVK
jgi:hypothetical protein